MNINTKLKSNVWKFYVITALGIRFITPIRIIYLLSFGLSYAQIGVMELAAAVAIVVLEIPTGIFADLFGRKKSRLIAYVFSIVAFSFLSFGSTVPIFIFGWMLSGIADAFQSGAQDAIIFDTFKQIDREKDYIKTKSHFVLINAISIIVGSLVGAYLYTIDRRLPWYLITLTIVLSAIVFLTIKEPKYLPKYGSIKSRFLDFGKSLSDSLKSIQVRKLILLGLILMIPMYVFTTLINQPYLLSRGFDVKSLGIIFAVITGIGGLVGFFSHKIEKYLKMRLSFLFIFASFTLILISMGLINSKLVLILVIGFYIVDNFKNVILDNYLNGVITSESRATVLSVQSFFNNIIISILFVFIGHMVDIFSIDLVLIMLGVMVLIFGLFLGLLKNFKIFSTNI